jgi:hypothetical protein
MDYYTLQVPLHVESERTAILAARPEVISLREVLHDMVEANRSLAVQIVEAGRMLREEVEDSVAEGSASADEMDSDTSASRPDDEVDLRLVRRAQRARARTAAARARVVAKEESLREAIREREILRSAFSPSAMAEALSLVADAVDDASLTTLEDFRQGKGRPRQDEEALREWADDQLEHYLAERRRWHQLRACEALVRTHGFE